MQPSSKFFVGRNRPLAKRIEEGRAKVEIINLSRAHAFGMLWIPSRGHRKAIPRRVSIDFRLALCFFFNGASSFSLARAQLPW